VLDDVTGTLITSVHVRPGQRRHWWTWCASSRGHHHRHSTRCCRRCAIVMDKAALAVQYVVPVHARGRPDGAARGRAGHARRAALRERDAAHAGPSRSVVFQGIAASSPRFGLLSGLLAACGATSWATSSRVIVFNLKYTFDHGCGSSAWLAGGCWSASPACSPRAQW